jgi:hypothetical protein
MQSSPGSRDSEADRAFRVYDVVSLKRRLERRLRRLLRLRHADLPAGAVHDSPHDVVVGRGRVIGRAVVDRDCRELADDRRRPPAAPIPARAVRRATYRAAPVRPGDAGNVLFADFSIRS